MIYSLIILLNYHRYEFELSDQEETILKDIISHFNQEQLTEERVVEKIIISWFYRLIKLQNKKISINMAAYTFLICFVFRCEH